MLQSDDRIVEKYTKREILPLFNSCKNNKDIRFVVWYFTSNGYAWRKLRFSSKKVFSYITQLKKK